MKEMKRVLSFVLCLVMLFGLIPASALTALAAEGTPTIVIAGSDYQESGTAPETNVKNILAQIKKDYSTVHGFLFGGDYSQTINDSTSTASGIRELKGVVQGVYGTSLNEVYVQGNHDASVNDLTATGDHDTDDYGVFVIKEDDFSSSHSGSSVANTAMLSALESYLEAKVEAEYSKPIFVATHLPLHATSRGDNTGASEIFTLLNEAGESGLNIIFLFGHNHSRGYDAYLGNGSIYLPKGSSITVAGGSPSTLNFTYMNYGYVGYVSGSADTTLTMTAFEITDNEVTVKRYDANGLHNLKSKGVATSSYAANTDEYGYAELNLSNGTSTIYSLSDDSGDDNTGSGDNSGSTGGTGYTYELVTEIKAGEEYVIVGNDHAVALMDNGGSFGSQNVTISGTTLTSDVALTEWTISGTSGGTIISDQKHGLSYSDSSFNLTGAADNTFDITAGNGDNFMILTVRTHSNYNKYYFNYDGNGWTSKPTSAAYVRLYKPTGTGTGGGSTATPEGGDWVTISDGTGQVVYELDTDGVDAGSKYLIVSDDEAVAMSAAANSGNSVDIEFNSDETEAYIDSTDYEWTIGASGNGYKMYNADNDYIGCNSSAISNDNSDVWTIVGNGEGAYTIKTGNYVLRYSGTNSAFRVGSSHSYSHAVRLYKYDHTETSVAEYANLQGGLTYTVSRGATAEEALAAVKEGISVQTSANADGSSPTTLEDGNANIKWKLASGYDGDTPGEYAVTISYKGIKLGTAQVIVPDVGVEADDVLYYIDETKSAPIHATVTQGTPGNGTFAYGVVEDSDAIIGSIAKDGGTITFTGTEGTAQVKITYTYSEGENNVTLEKVIHVTAKNPYYTIELCDPVTDDDGSVTGYEPITAPIVRKGVKAGDTHSLWAVVKEFNAEHPEGDDLGDLEDIRLRWTVSNTSIATIDPATGVLTFTGTSFGTFTVTVYYLDEEGEPICGDTITVSASESLYVVPGDGTGDFPEYPEQGAIRFDKTAVAQGSFSQSGIAKVELSMTGVPYGSSVPTDVVIMVDMTTSMQQSDSVDDANAAIKNMLEALVYDAENDKYDPNIYVQVWSFKSDDDGENVAFEENLPRRNITGPEDLAAAKTAIAFNTGGNHGYGTCYDEGTKKMYEIVQSCTTKNVVAVFASDGEATRYAYLDDDGAAAELEGYGSLNDGKWFNTDGSVTSNYKTEYYTYLLKTKQNPVPVYTVGINIKDETDAARILEHMSSEYDATGKVVSTAPANVTTNYFALANANTTADELSVVFEGIAASIREAATNVVVEDKIDSHYTVNFSLPSGVTADKAGGMEDFYIQVLGYELDENNDRKDNPTVLEKFLFNYDGTITHTIGATTCDGCKHVTKINGKVTGIDGTYFDYKIDAEGDEFLTWTADKLDRTELALEYFVYLDNSAGVEPADQVAPGTYPTNEYATITYKNFNGKECQQYFPVPTMTWMGAKVTYTFYLVNEAGQPVNRAGKVIPFAEAIYVTDPVTYDVTWNELEGSENMLAENLLATAKVPDVYSLYDSKAYYEIRVYQTEDANKNYFIIEGYDPDPDSDSDFNKETTKVFNTKAGIRYDDYGAYSATAGSYTSNLSKKTYTATITNNIDYANTTVAFAVVWKPELVPDAVVVDYGLDVVIDVTTNDSLASGVTGVSATAPNVAINSGTYQTSAMGTSDDIKIDDLIVGTASKENLTSVRFSLNKSSGMQFSESVKFFYESQCNYYTYDNAGNRTLNTTHMYSSVTVIPATTVYYEDDFLTLASFSKSRDTWAQDENSKWIASVQNGVQDQDRPGESKISEALDADNNYGYDGAYETMSKHSMDSAAKITVDAKTRGEATFTFWGTGFDVIGLTSNTTGTLTVQVYAGNAVAGDAVKTTIVDTYYGYTRQTDAAGNETWVTTNDSDNALYQVPVIKMFDLDYGRYTVKITAGYNDYFNHTATGTGGSYDLYLDAIRIYNPTGNQDTTANGAYQADGEAYPSYFEVRDQIIAKKTFDSLKENDSAVGGIVFIDGGIAKPFIEDYTSYGPNNETYLAKNQAIAFDLNATAAAGREVAKVQLAVKSVGGTGAIEVYGMNDGTKVPCLNQTISTATDMYYDITALNGMTVVIKSTGDAIISITNVKVTYTAAQHETDTGNDDETGTDSGSGTDSGIDTASVFTVSRSSANIALMSLRAPAVEDDTTEPEESVPEETEPEETTEPEGSVPEETEPEETVPETTVPEETETEPTEPDVTEPEEDPSEDVTADEIAEAVKKIVKKLFGWLFG